MQELNPGYQTYQNRIDNVKISQDKTMANFRGIHYGDIGENHVYHKWCYGLLIVSYLYSTFVIQPIGMESVKTKIVPFTITYFLLAIGLRLVLRNVDLKYDAMYNRNVEPDPDGGVLDETFNDPREGAVGQELMEIPQ